MTDEPTLPDNRPESDPESLTGPPRWVKISAIAVGILILIVVAVMLLTGGQHGPARHGFGMDAPASSPGAVQSQADTSELGNGSGQV
jgi:hypothetical protein